ILRVSVRSCDARCSAVASSVAPLPSRPTPPAMTADQITSLGTDWMIGLVAAETPESGSRGARQFRRRPSPFGASSGRLHVRSGPRHRPTASGMAAKDTSQWSWSQWAGTIDQLVEATRLSSDAIGALAPYPDGYDPKGP